MTVFTKAFSVQNFRGEIFQRFRMLLLGFCCISFLSCTPYVHPPMDHMNHGKSENAQPTQSIQPMDEKSVQSAEKRDPLLYSDRQHAAILTSVDGIYRVSLFSNDFPLSLQKIHNWNVNVETSDGQPLEDAKITVHGLMPEHQHGFPTRVRVTDYLGNGDYRVEGVKFSMPGHWQIRFNIKEKNRRDTVVFDVNL